MFPIPTSRKMKHFNNSSPHVTEYTWALIWKKSLVLTYFESYSLSHTGRVDRNVNTLLMGNINPLCKW